MLFSSCEDKVKGYTKVHEKISFSNKKIDFNLEPGNYLTEVKISLTQELSLSFYKEQKEHFVLLTKKKIEVPNQDHFEHVLSHTESHQKYDLKVSVDTKVAFSNERARYHLCASDQQNIVKTKFKNKLTTKYIEIDFVEPKSGKIVAHFTGTSTDDSELIISATECKKTE